MIYTVDVAVALARPPATAEWRHYVVEATDVVDAQLCALQMASCTSVMPVEALWPELKSRRTPRW